ncbi:cyclopropane-fatty-acyl-phospholipid synthase family protein [Streptomyces sp. NBC_00536]|uniref:cyclopropane-fatty-acyl-phospholipid synthase family protein n=1 Tax=Streptomyces sp. NBC_00536 TaxID=2975769 RepID=UPI002E807B2D|nr:cyclopropane-fatty-acyl-phospholipid synthase family protein [Streptomyces sp. NBC_00536]WUC79428.1 cyclopropane-fatty-acyl-phospholipid synthase family protein [Streptomyces sp. NBC_00536]
MTDAAPRLAALAETLLGAPLPVRIRAWDGSEAGPPAGPALVIHHRRALRRMLWKPGEVGLARAWVSGDLTVEGDLYDLLDRVSGLLWQRSPDPDDEPGAPPDGRPQGPPGAPPEGWAAGALAAAAGALEFVRDPGRRAALRELTALAGPLPPPAPPGEEVPRRAGPRHTKVRDRQAISHHYDVGNDFYALVLGPSMVYSCAYWSPGGDLEGAQRDKLDLVCRKLGLRPGDRLLDVGCGWGSMVLHAAREYGVRATGITLSREQAAFARKRIAEEGLTDRIEIRVQDYRDVVDGPYDAISSIGMAEHVGSARYRQYAGSLYALLRPGGRLLNHQIARRPEADAAREAAYRIDPFIDAYVFPDGELSPVGTTVGELERAGFEVRDVEALREHYALTLRAWVTRLEEHWEEAVRLTSPGRARVWLLYMAASALGFEQNRLGVNQVLAVRTPGDGAAGLAPRTREWLG